MSAAVHQVRDLIQANLEAKLAPGRRRTGEHQPREAVEAREKRRREEDRRQALAERCAAIIQERFGGDLSALEPALENRWVWNRILDRLLGNGAIRTDDNSDEDP